jgi:hypothetical protein
MAVDSIKAIGIVSIFWMRSLRKSYNKFRLVTASAPVISSGYLHHFAWLVPSLPAVTSLPAVAVTSLPAVAITALFAVAIACSTLLAIAIARTTLSTLLAIAIAQAALFTLLTVARARPAQAITCAALSRRGMGATRPTWHWRSRRGGLAILVAAGGAPAVGGQSGGRAALARLGRRGLLCLVAVL